MNENKKYSKPLYNFIQDEAIADNKITKNTVLTIATADILLNTEQFYSDFRNTYAKWNKKYLHKIDNNYNKNNESFIGLLAFAFDDEQKILYGTRLAMSSIGKKNNEIKNAQGFAIATNLAKKGLENSIISKQIKSRFGYNISEYEKKIISTVKNGIPNKTIEKIENYLPNDMYEIAENFNKIYGNN